MALWNFTALPANTQDLVLSKWLRSNFANLKAFINYGGRDYVQFEKINLSSDLPPKPQEGCLVYVKEDILPGNQKGFYYWDGTAWLKL